MKRYPQTLRYRILLSCVMSCVALLFMASASSAAASGQNSAQSLQASSNACLSQIPDAAEHYGVPFGLLVAMARVESTRPGTDEPWPWTLNIRGDSKFLDTKQGTLTAIAEHWNGEGRPPLIDIGCMQINLRYHLHEFDGDIPRLLDPATNVFYSAWFLRQLYDKAGNWTAAVARYHAGARNTDAQKRYACLVLDRLIRSGNGRIVDEATELCSGRYARYLTAQARQ